MSCYLSHWYIIYTVWCCYSTVTFTSTHNRPPISEISGVFCAYRVVSNIRRTKSQYLNDSHLVLKSSLANHLKPSVKSRMKMWLEQRRQTMLQLHLSDRQLNCLPRCVLYGRLDGGSRSMWCPVHCGNARNIMLMERPGNGRCDGVWLTGDNCGCCCHDVLRCVALKTSGWSPMVCLCVQTSSAIKIRSC